MAGYRMKLHFYMLQDTLLYCTTLHYTTLCYTIPYNAKQYNTILYQNPVNKIQVSQDVPLFGH